jgi:hypothetical protein
MDPMTARQLMTWLSKQASEEQERIIDATFGTGAFARLLDRLEVTKKRELVVWRKGTSTEAAAEIAAKRMKSLSETTTMRRLPDGTKRKAIQGKYFLLIKRLRNEGYSWGLIREYLKKFHSFRTTSRYLQAIYEEADASYRVQEV